MLQRPVLVLVTDRRRAAVGNLASAVDGAVAGGVRLVILREKDLLAGELLALAEALRAVTRGRALLVVNDRLDVALASGADGVHLGEAGLPVRAARKVAGAHGCFLVGRSVHTAEGACRAAEDGADYLLAGNIYATATHPGRPAAGTQLLTQAVSRVRQPVFAIGGITAANAGECLRARAQGVAVISAILGAPDPEGAARELAAAMVLEGVWENGIHDDVEGQWGEARGAGKDYHLGVAGALEGDAGHDRSFTQPRDHSP